MSPALPATELAALLTDWLPRQRWFAAKGRPIGSVTVTAVTPLITEDATEDGPPLLDHVVAAVGFADGGADQHYQLLLARRPAVRAEIEHVTLGRLGELVGYDGLWDPAVTSWLLAAIRSGTVVGDLRFVPEPGADVGPAAAGRVLGVEQSNTSVAYGESSIFKLYRNVVAGENPDLELHRALRSMGSTQVAELRGAVEGTLHGAPATLGMLQDYAANSAEGWAMALASVRDLLAEGDLRADEVGGDFAAEAHRLGVTVAVVHGELARALGSTHRDPAEIATTMTTRLTRAAAEVPALAGHVEAVRAVFDELAALGVPVPAQRVHGDLHLGQTLRTPLGWLLIDFEGEPATPLAQRVRPDTPLRDVAGMLRSFDYAAHHQLLESEDEVDQQRAWRADEWAARNRGAFCDGYAAHSDVDPRAHQVVLRAFELDKAVYEVVYETRNRPGWVPIPLGSIARLVSRVEPVP